MLISVIIPVYNSEKFLNEKSNPPAMLGRIE